MQPLPQASGLNVFGSSLGLTSYRRHISQAMLHAAPPINFETVDDPLKKMPAYQPAAPPATPSTPVPPVAPLMLAAGSPVSVRATDLIPREGLAHETYRMALGTLMSSLARFNYGERLKTCDKRHGKRLHQDNASDYKYRCLILWFMLTLCIALPSMPLCAYWSAVIQLPPNDEALVRYTMDSTRLFFQVSVLVPLSSHPSSWRMQHIWCAQHPNRLSWR